MSVSVAGSIGSIGPTGSATQPAGGAEPTLAGSTAGRAGRSVDAVVPPDLSSPSQIHDLVTTFYREIVFDDLLEPVFSEVAEVDWAEHIPNLIDYWCWILLGLDGYSGAVTRTHRHLHELQPLEARHCDRWYELWERCIDGRWAGPCADHAKRHAAHLMAGMAKHVFGFTWQPPGSDRTTAGR